MKNLIKVYVASQYSDGGKITNKRKLLDNVLDSIKIGDHLIELGFAPFLPLLNHFQDQIYPRPGSTWLKLDFQWLSVCNCVLRLNGKSNGADEEEKLAGKLGIPVFYNIEDLIEWSLKNKSDKSDVVADNIRDHIQATLILLNNLGGKK